MQMEFFGPWGCGLFTLMLPAVPFLLTMLCDEEGCAPDWIWQGNFDLLSLKWSNTQFFQFTAFQAYLSWFMFQLVLYLIVPGQWVKGVQLRNGQALDYKINAFRVLIVTHAVLAAGLYYYGLQPLVWISQNVLPLSVAAYTVACLQAVVLYIVSFRSKNVLLSLVGNAGHPVHDFWMGRELNPRIGWIDLKYFCELRPGMFLWALLNYAYMAKQYVDYNYVTPTMLLVVFGQLVYIADSVWFESAILTTMDITTDGFGYMLSIGDLLWVPFTFSLQARYMSYQPVFLPGWVLMGLTLMMAASYYTFRSSNSQKNTFRTNPSSPQVAHLEYLTTASGSKLLVTGWWGLSRHINYLGDWMLGLSWCLCTGLSSPIPYFYVLYFAPLLIHRSFRDDHKCRLKYGADWQRYCSRVPYRIIPWIF